MVLVTNAVLKGAAFLYSFYYKPLLQNERFMKLSENR